MISAREIVARAKAAGDAGYLLATAEERDAAEVAHRLGCVRLDLAPGPDGSEWHAYLVPSGELLLEEPADAPHEAEPRRPSPSVLAFLRAVGASPATGYKLSAEPAEQLASARAMVAGFVELTPDDWHDDGAPRYLLTPAGAAAVTGDAGDAEQAPIVARVRARVAARKAERAAAVPDEELRYALHLAAAVDARDGVGAALMPGAFRALQGAGLVEHFRGRAPFDHNATIRARPTDVGRAYLAYLRDTTTPPARVTDVELRRVLRDASRPDGAPAGTALRFAAALTLTAAGLAEPRRRPYVADVFDLFATEAGRAALARPPWVCAVPDDEVWNVLAFLAAPAEASRMPPRARVALDALCAAALAQRVPGEHEAEARYQRTAYGDEEIRWHRARQTADEAVKDFVASRTDVFRAPYAPPGETPAPRPDGAIVALLRSLDAAVPGAWVILSAGERCALPVLTAVGHAEEDVWRGIVRARITDAGRAHLATLDDGASVAASIRAANAETAARRDAFLRECIEVEEVATDVLLTAVRRFAARAHERRPGRAPGARGGVTLADTAGGQVRAEAYALDAEEDEAIRFYAGRCLRPTEREALRDLARRLYDTTPAAPEGSAAQ